jgi:sporulation protein YlmC with PRC-barrel domain
MGYGLEATDGDCGKVNDLLFDENLWLTRYLVADTGGWLIDRRVLLPPSVLGQPSWKESIIPVNLTKSDIENSPKLDEDAPVSRQHEIMLYRDWNLQPYWEGRNAPGVYPIPAKVQEIEKRLNEKESSENSDPYLRSFNEVKGYDIDATDGEIGQVEDILFDDETWVIRYLVVDTRKWLPGKKVIIPLIWVEAISWAEQSIIVDVDKDKIKNSPEFDPTMAINREQEEILYDYYGRPKYWLSV